MCSTLEQGQDLSPPAPSSVGKAEAELPKTEKAKGDPGEDTKVHRSTNESRCQGRQEGPGTNSAKLLLDQEMALSGLTSSTRQ